MFAALAEGSRVFLHMFFHVLLLLPPNRTEAVLHTCG